jgi:hypothetical protein
MGTLQTGLEPRHAPLQVRKLQPFAGFAVSRSGTYEGNTAEHRGRHVIPDLAVRTVPRPETAMVSRYTSGAKSADTDPPGASLTLHADEPPQPSLQRTSFAPGPGVADSPSWVSVFQVVVQVCVH